MPSGGQISDVLVFHDSSVHKRSQCKLQKLKNIPLAWFVFTRNSYKKPRLSRFSLL